MRMLLTLDSTSATGCFAQFKRLAEYCEILARAARREFRCGTTDIRAVLAGPNALTHIHRLCAAGIRARDAEKGTKHRMTRRCDQVLIERVTHARVQPNHFFQ
jgi:hypothetical protein